MDRERQRRQQSLKVIISEIIMTLTVVVTVVILALIVSGYWINADFQIERQGLLQVYSIPTGATVEIDGSSSWFQRTNASKILASGEHQINLTKDGYDSWSKKIQISEGLLTRLSYPRLFLKERAKENLLDLSGALAAYVSPNREIMLLTNNTTSWSVISLDRTEIEPKSLDISTIFSSVSVAEDATAGLFTGQIATANWNRDNTRILFSVQNDIGTEWVLLDVKNPKNSTNITKDFGANFDRVTIIDNSANNLIAIINQKMHKIDVSAKSISSVIVDDIIDYSIHKNEVIFSALDAEQSPYLAIVKLGDDRIQKLDTIPYAKKAVISEFYEDKYISIMDSNIFSIYEKENQEEIATVELTFAPNNIMASRDGSFIFMSLDSKIAVFDMETTSVAEWDTGTVSFGWLDDHMIYTSLDGELFVYDYDGLNKRQLSKNVSSHFPVTITANKWIYYSSDDQLVREWLVAR